MLERPTGLSSCTPNNEKTSAVAPVVCRGSPPLVQVPSLNVPITPSTPYPCFSGKGEGRTGLGEAPQAASPAPRPQACQRAGLGQSGPPGGNGAAAGNQLHTPPLSSQLAWERPGS